MQTKKLKGGADGGDQRGQPRETSPPPLHERSARRGLEPSPDQVPLRGGRCRTLAHGTRTHLGEGWRGLGGLGRGGGPLLEGGHAVRHAHGGGVVALRARQEPQLRRHAGRARRARRSVGCQQRQRQHGGQPGARKRLALPPLLPPCPPPSISGWAPLLPLRVNQTTDLQWRRTWAHGTRTHLGAHVGPAHGAGHGEADGVEEGLALAAEGFAQALHRRLHVPNACALQWDTLFSGTSFSVRQAFQWGTRAFNGPHHIEPPASPRAARCKGCQHP